jgi:hypothetical protein
MDVRQQLAKAQRQLEKVQVAWLDPVDWSDLSIYGVLALENAVVAAAEHLGVPWQRTHPSKSAAAKVLHEDHGLPNVVDLMLQLWDMRQSESYGDVAPPLDLDAEDVARDVEGFVEAVQQIIGGTR